ncbi:MAG TPA: hypothetical protein VMR73_02110 [Candidatus Paceibacterota bacterium]|nr:hypothetical protein [Candidatus Paceibacterota bacterium]
MVFIFSLILIICLGIAGYCSIAVRDTMLRAERTEADEYEIIEEIN